MLSYRTRALPLHCGRLVPNSPSSSLLLLVVYPQTRVLPLHCGGLPNDSSASLLSCCLSSSSVASPLWAATKRLWWWWMEQRRCSHLLLFIRCLFLVAVVVLISCCVSCMVVVLPISTTIATSVRNSLMVSSSCCFRLLVGDCSVGVLLPLTSLTPVMVVPVLTGLHFDSRCTGIGDSLLLLVSPVVPDFFSVLLTLVPAVFWNPADSHDLILWCRIAPPRLQTSFR
jgi:hypothetical protein